MTDEGLSPSVFVALDLETTGLNSERDAITEIGAVKFQGKDTLETFQTLVNPYREIPAEVRRLTGISQKSVDRAPPFSAVAGQLRDFIGPHPIVGHNIPFDISFLTRHGLELSNPLYDTRDLASILMPSFNDYSLSGLAGELGAEHARPHRALDDARATHGVFVSLIDRLGDLDGAAVAYIGHLASRARWPIGRLFKAATGAVLSGSDTGLTGLDMHGLAKRLGRPDRLVKANENIETPATDDLAAFLGPNSLFARAFDGFEHRPQQVEMMRAVADAFEANEHLIVEAGTGVGKSMAYLLPAVLRSLRSGERVVISTNTINLQEQLLNKDIPALVGVLERGGIIPEGEFRVAPLKGRANYLCLRRWDQLGRGDNLSSDDTRLLGKTLVWLRSTETGDRAEINLAGRDAVVWNRLSAGEKRQCPGTRGEGPCFLRAARDRAEGAHVVVVNHALLLSDLAMGGGLLPDYRHLIVDEAHHLEEEATRQMGFSVPQGRLGEALDTLARLLTEARVLLRTTGPQRGEELVADLESRLIKRVKDSWDKLWNVLDGFLDSHQGDGGDQPMLRITRSTRSQPGWSEVELAWENVDVVLSDATSRVDTLRRSVEAAPSGGPLDPGDLTLELTTWLEDLSEMQDRLKSLLVAPSEELRIDWMARLQEGRGDPSGRSYNLALHSAPLDVGQDLETELFSNKDSVILTSATLSTQGTFDYIRQRVGLADGKELLVGSPFDYRKAALLLLPEDMPPPDSWPYQSAMEELLSSLARRLGGHTLVLFTSHSALRGAAQGLRPALEAEGIRVLAQGVDGSPKQIVRSFGADPSAVILGTSSFWEGVDLSGGILKALVLARLPFHVPTEPIFAARSDHYEDPFHQYALPQAVLRFRQGFGRLIRGSQDRGCIVTMDSRITSRAYGKAFLDSLPPCTVKQAPLGAIPEYAAEWSGTASRNA